MPPSCSGSGAETLRAYRRQGCLRHEGNRAFHDYATGRTREGPEGSRLFRTDEVTCFRSLHDADDRLCILNDFAVGRASVDAMAPSQRGRGLTALIQAALRDPDAREANTLCLRRRGQGSVGWTHAHIFDARRSNPENILHDGSYCWRLR